MKKFKNLCIMLAMFLFVFNISTTYASAFSIIDISEDTDSFSMYVGAYESEYSDNDYYPYVDSNGDGNIYVRISHNYDNADLRVYLYDNNTGKYVDYFTDDSTRFTCYFENLNPNHRYYLRFRNRSDFDADFDVYVF